jgi:hypothetical protein
MFNHSHKFTLPALLLLCGAALGAAISSQPATSSRPATSTRPATATKPTTFSRPATSSRPASTRATVAFTPTTSSRPTTARQAVSQPGVPGDLDLLTTVGNVTVNLPAGWALNVGRQVMIETHPATPDKDATGTFQASITINQVKLSSSVPGAVPKADVGLGANQQAIDAKKETAYQAVEKPAAIVVNGLSGVKFGGAFKRGATDLRNREYFLARNNEVYLITFTCLNSRWPAYQKLLEESVATFTLNK